MIDLTVLIATHNGENVVGRTLEGYCDVCKQDEDWKLVIINNASTDRTAEILKSYESRLPMTVLNVADPGKNTALNAGLKHIEGDLIILSDDDSIPQPGFLNQWRETSKHHPEFDVIGGSIHLVFDVEPPTWFLNEQLHFEELYAVRENVPAGPIEPTKIYGPNMAARRRVFDAGVTFDPTIGPNGADKNYSMGSENAFCLSAVAAGFSTGFSPLPLVHHIVRAHQITQDYWANRAYKLGRGVAQRAWNAGHLKLKKRSMPIELIARSYYWLKRAWLKLPTLLPGDRQQFVSRWNYQFYLGFQDQHCRQKKSAKTGVSGSKNQTLARYS